MLSSSRLGRFHYEQEKEEEEMNNGYRTNKHDKYSTYQYQISHYPLPATASVAA